MLLYYLLLFFSSLVISNKETVEHIKKRYDFMQEIAYIETRGNPYITGGYNNSYIGKYQFSQLVLNDMGFHMPISKFRKNPKKYFPEYRQDSLCYEYFTLMKKNYFKYLIPKYKGKVINGVRMNEATILAGGHFIGVGAMRKYLLSYGKTIPKDGWGGSLVVYIKRFQYIGVKF